MLQVAPSPAYWVGDQRIPITPEVIDQLARGTLQLQRIGQLMPLRLNRAQRDQLELAKTRGYVITPQRDHNLRSLYGLYCDVTKRPFIVIDPRVQYASLECDPIMCDWKPSPAGIAIIDELWTTVATTGWHTSGPTFIYHSKVPISQAEPIAARLWQLYQEETHHDPA